MPATTTSFVDFEAANGAPDDHQAKKNSSELALPPHPTGAAIGGATSFNSLQAAAITADPDPSATFAVKERSKKTATTFTDRGRVFGLLVSSICVGSTFFRHHQHTLREPVVCVVFLRPWEGVGATSVSSNWDQLGTKLIRKSQWAPTNRSSQQGQRRAGVPAGPSIRAWGLLRVGGAVEKGQSCQLTCISLIYARLSISVLSAQ